MVFSLFRKSDKSGSRSSRDAADIDVDTTIAPTTRVHGSRSTGSAAREAARLTAEKIDQIESEMISDDDDMLLAPDRGSAVEPPHIVNDTAEDVERALAKLREKTQAARAERGSSFDSQVETLAETMAGSPEQTDVDELSEPFADSSIGTGPVSLADLDFGADTLNGSDENLDSANLIDANLGDAAELAEPVDSLAGQTEGKSLPEELEEAAILYSNGESEVAEGVLSDALERDSNPDFRTMTWHMLFDLHRVTGDRESFDKLAIAYASDTECSPPAWSSDLMQPKAKAGKPNASPSHAVIGESLAADARKIVDQLIRAAGHQRDCSIDFTALKTLAQDGAEQLSRLIAEFAKSQHPIKIYQIDALLDVAKSQVEIGRRDDSEAFWKLAMTCLQVKQLRSEFDDLSIDYCVTFEVSPPPWEDLPAVFLLQDDATFVDDEPTTTTTAEPEPDQPSDVLVLTGELCGKIAAQRQAIRAISAKHKVIRLDCKRLRRIDFVAAGELLNEQLALQSESKVLRFQAPNFLIYALMRVMGIHELAQIKGKIH